MKTILNIKTDKTLKEGAQEIAKELGLPLSTVINSFLKQFIRDREVTFSASYNPSPQLKGLINDARRDYEEGRVKTHTSLQGLLDFFEA